MQDEDKSKEQLITELHELRKRVAKSEQYKADPNRAEIAVMQERDFTQAVLDSLPGLFYFLDQQGQFLRWNREFERVSGYSAEEICRMSFLDFFNEPDKWIIAERIDKVFKTGEVFAEGELVSKDQTKTPFYFTGKLFRFEEKPCLIGMGIDITERKQAEEALLESENKFKSFSEQALAGICLIQDGVFKYVNPKFAQMFGYTVEECLNDMPYKNLVYAEDVNEVEERVRRRVVGEAESVHYTFRGLKKNGQIFPLEIYGSVIVYQGKPAATGTILDITERKRAEKALEESEEKYRRIVETANEGICVADEDYLFTYVNQKMADMLGYLPEEIIGKPLVHFLFPEDLADHQDKRSHRIEGLNETYERRFRRSDGGECWAKVAATVTRTEDGRFVGSFAMLTDITERKRAEDALRVSLRFLGILHQHTEIAPLLREYVSEIKNYTGCDAVGIRVLDENWNIPYQAYQGFSRKFYETESSLSLKTDECMCISVIRGDVDPSLPFFTEGGAFCVNATSRFLATVSEEEKGRTRNRCNREGYETVGLFPFRSGGRIFGLVHVADHRENMLPPDVLEVLEKAALQLGTAFQRAQAEEALRESQQMLQSVMDTIPVRVFWKDLASNFLGCNRPFALDAGLQSPEELIGRNDFAMCWGEQADLYRSDDRLVMETGIAKLGYEEPQTMPDGGRIWLRTSKVPLFDVKGEKAPVKAGKE